MKASTTVARHRASRAFARITCACVLAICAGQSASAAIPAGERQALLGLYNETGGPSWFDNLGWGGAPGTECEWVHVICNDEGTHVVELYLFGNELSGTLPPLDGLTALQALVVNYNKLYGTIPDLSGLAELVAVNFDGNQFVGNIPALPSGIHFFAANSNLLTGSIPLLSAYPELTTFWVSRNHLTGEIPSLSALHALFSFYVDDNDLDGAVPAVKGLTMLSQFNASANRLTGPLPALADTPNLDLFDVRGNDLTGTMPPFGDLPFLQTFNVDHNQLTGPPPPGPLPPQLRAVICPNFLDHVESEIWDMATGITPWYRDCVLPDAVFANGFEL